MSDSNYRGFRITEIHAITTIGDDDEEAIPAFMSGAGPVPMISSDRVRLDHLTKMAQLIADETGRRFKIVKFSVREDVGEIKSSRKPS